MPMPQGFQQAELKIGSDTIKCAFNPQSYQISKTNVYTYKPTPGNDLPTPEFGGGLPAVFKITLLLDDTLGIKQGAKSVKDAANALIKMMHVAGGQPPKVNFSWGSSKLPESVPVGLDINYALFRPNGDPVRAWAAIELAQSDKFDTSSAGSGNATQNPTTRAERGTRVHTVTDGDSLPSLAFQSYGDATRWRTIAEANGIDDPIRLRSGTTLTIPGLD